MMFYLLQLIMSPLLGTLLRWRRDAVSGEEIEETVPPTASYISKISLKL